MYDFETLMEEVLKSRPELNRDELMGRIEEKKNTVGAGYLTSQGALFLIAGELGVTLKQTATSDLTLKDLYVGANDVTVVARVLALYPPSTYNKKDGGQGRYRRVVLFDKDRSVKVTLWEERADDIEKNDVSVGTVVRVLNGYVKQDLDGKPNLSLGKRGKLELVSEESTVKKVATLEAATEALPNVPEERPFAALDCFVTSESRYSEFVRSDGTPGSLFQFGVGARGGKDQFRVVIWGPTERPEVSVGQKVRVTNVRSRRSSRGELEIHGDSGSTVTVLEGEERIALRAAAVLKESTNTIVLCVDRDKNVRVVEALPGLTSAAPGELLSVSAGAESGGRLICRSKNSIRTTHDPNFPDLADLGTKVKDARSESSMIMTEVIALSHGTIEDVHMKDGEVVKKGELVVGDESGEMKLVGWRELSGRMSGIEPGERLRLVGVTPKATKMGSWVLQASALTAIEKIRSGT